MATPERVRGLRSALDPAVLKARNFAQVVITTIALWTATGIGVLVIIFTLGPALSVADTAQRFERAGRCSDQPLNCYSVQAATVEDLKVTGSSKSRSCRLVLDSPAGRRVEYTEFRSACDVFKRGQSVLVSVWEQRITAIAPSPNGGWRRTLENPSWVFENDRLGVIIGSLTAIAGLVLSILFWRRYRWPGGPRPVFYQTGK